MGFWKINSRALRLPAAVLITGGGVLTLFLFLVRATHTLELEIRHLQQRAEALPVPRATGTERSLVEVQQFLREWYDNQVGQAEASRLVSLIDESLESRHIRMVRYAPKEWKSLDWLQWCDMRFELVGRSPAVVLWLSELGQRKLPLVIRQCELSKAQGEGEVRCILEFSVYSEKFG